MAQVEEDLAAFKASHAPLASGEVAEVLTSEQQDAKSWAIIENWWAKQSFAALVISFEEPFGSATKPYFYVGLPSGYLARGRTRSDALAHAAEWCKGQL